MAMNKYMHPRNIYKTPPNFAELAKTYKEFSSISKVGVTGKVSIDFKDPHSLRVLTKCLLKSDFGLDVVIPEDRLVPTLPLRLNYILWIEDLLDSALRRYNVRGVDIGTGACAIYPLLAAAKNKWHMVGTETDQESLLKAQENVDRNKMQNLIQVNRNPTTSLLEYLFESENAQTFDFCMCNPPFYSSVQELCESRSPARLPPKNGFTGSPQELITEGGELAFCRKMINESKVFRDKVLIFTTMVGHKYNLKELAQDLKADGIKHTSTEFCQGRVTRWGLAWTYQDFEINNFVPARKKLPRKFLPIAHILTQLPDLPYSYETVTKRLLEMLKDLKIDNKVLGKGANYLLLDIRAVENTWSNQRKKRRLMKALRGSHPKRPKLNEIDAVDGRTCEKTEVVASDSNNIKLCNEADTSSGDTNKEENENYLSSVNNSVLSIFSESHDMESEVNTSTKNIIHAFIKVLKKENDYILELEFLDGTAGKEGLHQILQYIKNNWK